MSAQFPDLNVDRLVHEPARMGILSILDGVDAADFLFLVRVLGLTKGNLSSHLTKLEDGGLIMIEKKFKGKTPQTLARITPAGHDALYRHRAQLQQLFDLSRRLPEQP